MTADTYGSILGLIQQGTGNNNNSWGTTFNTSFSALAERAIGGVNTITATSGTVDLSTTLPPAGPRLDIDKIQLANGSLVGDLTVKVPNVSKTWWFENDTSGAFNMFVEVPSGTSPNGLVQIPQGLGVMVMCDGNGNLRRHDRAEVGSFRISGKASAGSGELACNGASLLRTKYPDLFNAIGTTWGSADGTHFTLPLLTDTNRYLRAADGSTLTVGTYQSNQNLAHTHTITGAPAVGTLTTDNPGNHTHANTLTDPGHTHTVNTSQTGAGPGAGHLVDGGGTLVNTGSNTTGITITNAAAGSHTHSVTGTLTAGTLATASQGGTEARPESAAVLICIRY